MSVQKSAKPDLWSRFPPPPPPPCPKEGIWATIFEDSGDSYVSYIIIRVNFILNYLSNLVFIVTILICLKCSSDTQSWVYFAIKICQCFEVLIYLIWVLNQKMYIFSNKQNNLRRLVYSIRLLAQDCQSIVWKGVIIPIFRLLSWMRILKCHIFRIFTQLDTPEYESHTTYRIV